MARLGPEAHHTLPQDFAAALGQCVASFGWLEEVLKRTIYALDRARLADDLTPAEMQNWVERMGQLADDSMGTLIEQLDAAMRRHPGLRDRDQITEALGVRNCSATCCAMPRGGRRAMPDAGTPPLSAAGARSRTHR
ncbi:hypothetical protein ACEPPZ_12900 [Paracoccus yeei]|uniref:hypothetical protein n=1 Tax=Paracoccus yeei TaxID=147645 RepID=UPI0028D6D8E4|nr:hypothetical protein [Paracoccus yeei]